MKFERGDDREQGAGYEPHRAAHKENQQRKAAGGVGFGRRSLHNGLRIIRTDWAARAPAAERMWLFPLARSNWSGRLEDSATHARRAPWRPECAAGPGPWVDRSRPWW